MSQPNGKHTTKAERERRIAEVYRMLVTGLGPREIERVGNDKHGWNVSRRTISAYIAAATELLREQGRCRRDVELGRALARLNTQYAKADARKDHRGAALIEGRRIELLRLGEGTDEGRDELQRFLDLMERET